MASLHLDAVHKTYANGHRALCGLDLALADGELVTLVGPSGSGKSSALRIVAGLEAPDAGRVLIGARDVTDLEPRARDVAMVFQSYALYPHKSVRENLAFGLRMRGLRKDESVRRTSEIAERLGLTALLERKPAQLSGGQRQRVALGRALARRPQVFLLDEPLSNLDAGLRSEMRAEIGRLHAAIGVTTLYVTHDQEEAMTLGDRIAVLGAGGRLEQLAPPLEVYARPSNAFVAEFIGMPRINFFEGTLEDGSFACADFRLPLPGPRRGPTRVRLGVRPHDLRPSPPGSATLSASVELVEALGPSLLLHAQSRSAVPLRLVVPAGAGIRRGDTIVAAIPAEHAHVFEAGTGERI